MRPYEDGFDSAMKPKMEFRQMQDGCHCEENEEMESLYSCSCYTSGIVEVDKPRYHKLVLNLRQVRACHQRR